MRKDFKLLMENQMNYYNYHNEVGLNNLLLTFDSSNRKFNKYKFSQCQKVLFDHNKFINPNKDKYIILVNGPISSGKSSTIANLIKMYGLEGFEYINSEYYYFNYDTYKNQDLKKGYWLGKQEGLQRINYNLENSNSFIYEFVLAKQDKFDLIKYFKKKNYKIIGIFVYANLDTIYKRVLEREYEGYYHVEKEKINSRYKKTIDNIQYFKNCCDYFYFVNNYNECSIGVI